MKKRYLINNIFSASAWGSALLLIAVLAIVLLPIFYRGSTAVLFKGTVEFRKMQLDLFSRGDQELLEQEIQQVEVVRNELRDIIHEFRNGLDREKMIQEIRSAYRDYGSSLKLQEVDNDVYTSNRSIAKEVRDLLCDALESDDKENVNNLLDQVINYDDRAMFDGTEIESYFVTAQKYKNTIKTINLEEQSEVNASMAEIEERVNLLFGPPPGTPTPAMANDRYGMTRWDMVNKQLDLILFDHRWLPDSSKPDGPLVQVSVPRKEIFAGTEMETFFVRLEDEIESMFNPRFTFYWQYFIDDSYTSHYFGGIGPEILGTVILTFLSMVFVIPFGIITAAWLVECAKENMVTSIIRMSINSLAGVPSVVFGVFGMAFFVITILPMFNLEPVRCILAGSLTLALLTLPVMIRASEEAIRSVPITYKEASLGLGAGRTRTFIFVTLPAALPGILTGIILSLSRVAGETAPIIFTATFAMGPMPKSILDSTRTLSFGSYDMAVGDRIAMLVPHNQFGMVTTLIVLILLLNTVAIVLRARIFKKLKGH